MRDILEKLYLGEIRPAEKAIDGNAMKEKYKKIIQAEEEVMKSLDNESKMLFERYLAVNGEAHADAVIESYKDGFKTAVRLIFAGLAE